MICLSMFYYIPVGIIKARKKEGIILMSKINETRPLAVKPEDAARMLGIGRNLIYYMIKTGDITAIRLGERRLLVPVAALEKLLETDHQEAAIR